MSIKKLATAAAIITATAAPLAAEELPQLKDYLPTIETDVSATGFIRSADGEHFFFYQEGVGSMRSVLALGRDGLEQVKEACSGFHGCNVEIDAGLSVEKGDLVLTVFAVRNVITRGNGA